MQRYARSTPSQLTRLGSEVLHVRLEDQESSTTTATSPSERQPISATDERNAGVQLRSKNRLHLIDLQRTRGRGTTTHKSNCLRTIMHKSHYTCTSAMLIRTLPPNTFPSLRPTDQHPKAT